MVYGWRLGGTDDQGRSQYNDDMQPVCCLCESWISARTSNGDATEPGELAGGSKPSENKKKRCKEMMTTFNNFKTLKDNPLKMIWIKCALTITSKAKQSR